LIRDKIRNLANEIYVDVDHGECFYELDMLNTFCENLDKMKELALQHFHENKEENKP
jgi:hypothetical protein